MTDTQKDGGPAFPDQGQPMTRDGKWAQDWVSGMSLRDWFAGQALAGLSAKSDKRPIGWQRAITWDAYSLADVMLKQREEGTT